MLVKKVKIILTVLLVFVSSFHVGCFVPPPLGISEVIGSDITHAVGTIVWTDEKPTKITWTPDVIPTFTWKSNIPATSQIEYGISTTYGYSSTLDEALVTIHKVELVDLQKGKVYHYRVKSKDKNGNEVVSEDYTYGWCEILVDTISKVVPYNTLDEINKKLPPGYWAAIDSEAFLRWILDGLQYYTPAEQQKRLPLNIALDFAITASYDDSPFLKQIKLTNKKVLNALAEPVKSGLTIYKLYNDGTIIRTKDICVGVDLNCIWSDSEQFARVLDALFVTHNHPDHIDSSLLTAMQDLGKPVVVEKANDLVKFGEVLENGVIGKLQWTALSGLHYPSRFSGFFYFQVGEWSILHSGDNQQLGFNAESKYLKNLDVLLCDAECLYGQESEQAYQAALMNMLNLVRPRILLPQHMLEFIAHNVPTFSEAQAIRLYMRFSPQFDVKNLWWGESIEIPAKSKMALGKT
jgi:hypothetical protein